MEQAIQKIVVVGGGLMGGGIAQVFAEKGIQVLVVERSEEDFDRCKAQIEKMMTRLQASPTILNNITFTTNIADAADADFAIEAVPEKMNMKLDVFRQLDAVLPEHAIIASNTSSLSVAQMSNVTKRPEKVVGMHFFSPVPFMNEAAFLVMEGNDPADIDRGLQLGANHPIGPLKLADSLGIDVLYYTALSIYEGFNDSKYRPCPLLKRMVEAGHLGKKTGQGFYQYGGVGK